MKFRQILQTILIAIFASCLAIIIIHTSIDQEQFIQKDLITVVPEIVVPKTPETNLTSVTQKTIHSVVQIQVRGQSKYNYYWSNYKYPPLKNVDKDPPIIKTGSGVIMTSDGYIITNYHVVKEAEILDVVLYNTKICRASIIGTYPDGDLAVIKIKEDNLFFLTFGSSDALRLGERVIAIGSPFNLVSTVTAGIVSSKARIINLIKTEKALEAYIQIDAAVNPGNSGGPLINTRGELVGINSAIYSRSGAFCGLAFAIPSTIIQKVYQDIIKYDTIYRASLGVGVKNLTAETAKKYSGGHMEGVIVTELIYSGGAREGGIRLNDVISVVNGIKINNFAEFQEQIFRYNPNDQISIILYRMDYRIPTMPILQKIKKSVILKDLKNKIDKLED